MAAAALPRVLPSHTQLGFSVPPTRHINCDHENRAARRVGATNNFLSNGPTLGLKEMTQSILVRKLCTLSSHDPTRKAIFEFDKLIRSIYTLRYLRDPQLQRNVRHHAVLDAVMNHLHEVTGTAWTAVEFRLLRDHCLHIPSKLFPLVVSNPCGEKVNVLPPTLELLCRHRPASGKPNQKYTDPDQVDDNGN